MFFFGMTGMSSILGENTGSWEISVGLKNQSKQRATLSK
jgi:hypothetical protein